MLSQTLVIGAHSRHLCSMFDLRGFSPFSRNFYTLVAVLCTFAFLATSKDCPLHGQELGCRPHFETHISTSAGKNTEKIERSFSGVFSRPPVEITPVLLDWGQKTVYNPSIAYVTVKNIDSDGVLSVHEPYSSDSQFFPCNSSEILLAPGQIASICLVFLPLRIGLTSARLVLQTSFGGFLIHTKGFGLKSPYSIKGPLDGVSAKNLSLFNPFNEDLRVREVASWVLISGNTSRPWRTISTVLNMEDFSTQEWLDLENAKENSQPRIAIRPHNCVMSPRVTKSVMELAISDQFQGNIIGAFGLQLVRPSVEKVETVVVPLEIDFSQAPASRFSNMYYYTSGSMQALPQIKATTSFFSVLEDRAGNHHSQWIADKNLCQEPITAQSTLNSGEIVEYCRKTSEMHSKTSSNSTCPTRHSFPTPKDAPREKYRHPNSSAFLGLITYIQPWNLCEWMSSALVRSNLSGAVWFWFLGSGFPVISTKTSLPVILLAGAACLLLSSMFEGFGKSRRSSLCSLLTRLKGRKSKLMSPNLHPVHDPQQALRVSISSERKRRRRKKKISSFAGVVEASSSQSGNSTPSSPLSPHELTKRDNRHDERVTTPVEPALSKVGFLDTFLQSKDSPCLPVSSSMSKIDLHDRAPGPGRKPKVEKKGGEEKVLSYDIWGDHVFEISLSYRVKEGERVWIGNESESFFEWDPQSLMAELCA